VGGNISFYGHLVSRTPDFGINWGDGAAGDLGFNTVSALGVLTGSTRRMTILQNGNVVIGTPISTSTEKLDVDGNISIRGTHMVYNSAHGVIDWGSGSSGNLYFRTLSSQGNIGGYTDRMCITNSGTVGIGTTNPYGWLDIKTSPTIGWHGFLLEYDYTGAGYAQEIRVKNAGTKALVISNFAGTPYEAFTVYGDGRTVIGNASQTPVVAGDPYKLYVQTGILTEKVKVALTTSSDWSDYVFASDYKLNTLEHVESFVKEHKHLPGVPSAEEVVKEGLDLGKMDAKLLEKIEELTLYVIELNKQNKELTERLNKLESDK